MASKDAVVPERVRAVVMPDGTKLVSTRYGMSWGAWRAWKGEIFKTKRAALDSRKPFKGFAWADFNEKKLIPVTVDVRNGEHFCFDKSGQRVHGRAYRTKLEVAKELEKKAKQRLNWAKSERRKGLRNVERAFNERKREAIQYAARARTLSRGKL